jgi:hypothetical protein
VIPRDIQITLISIPATIGWFIALSLLGLVTGVYGMCQTASKGWIEIFTIGFFAVPPILGVATAIVLNRKSNKSLE